MVAAVTDWPEAGYVPTATMRRHAPSAVNVPPVRLEIGNTARCARTKGDQPLRAHGSAPPDSAKSSTRSPVPRRPGPCPPRAPTRQRPPARRPARSDRQGHRRPRCRELASCPGPNHGHPAVARRDVVDDGAEVIKALTAVVDNLLGEAPAALGVGQRQVRALGGEVDAPAAVDAGWLAPADGENTYTTSAVLAEMVEATAAGNAVVLVPAPAPAPAPATVPLPRCESACTDAGLGPGQGVGGHAHHGEEHNHDDNKQ